MNPNSTYQDHIFGGELLITKPIKITVTYYQLPVNLSSQVLQSCERGTRRSPITRT